MGSPLTHPAIPLFLCVEFFIKSYACFDYHCDGPAALGLKYHIWLCLVSDAMGTCSTSPWDLRVYFDDLGMAIYQIL